MAINVKVAGQEVKVNENAFDRAVRYFSPGAANRRLLQRAAYAVAGGYTGGSRDKRSLSKWKPLGNSADSDILPDLATLRERSRDLVRNEPLAAGAINTVTTNVVGTGLMLKSRVDREALGWSVEQAAQWQAAAQREFKMWSESTECDATRTQNFYGLQDLAFRSAFENGDAFALLPFLSRRHTPYQLAVQLIEADRVCNPDNVMDKPTLAGGVEMDSYGAPIRYHILTQHPGDRNVLGKKWASYGVYGNGTGRRNVLHLYAKRRIGQTRGVPYFAPVIEAFKQIGRYSEAEIFAAVSTAMFAIETKTEDRSGLSPLESAVTGATPTSGTSDPAKGTGWDGTLTPGLTIDLGINEEVKGFNPNRPNANFDPFVQAVLRQVGTALEIPFEVLIKHFTASYSAARSALLEAWKFYRSRRCWLADNFCQPVYAAFLEEAIALGRIPAPGFFDNPLLRSAYLGAQWHGDGPGSIDPMKEANAVEKRLQIGLRTLDQEIAEDSGSDFETVTAQRADERKKLFAAGLWPMPGTPAAPAAAVMPNDGEDPSDDSSDPDNSDNPDDPEDGSTPTDTNSALRELAAAIRQQPAPAITVNTPPVSVALPDSAQATVNAVSAGLGQLAGAVREQSASILKTMRDVSVTGRAERAETLRAVQHIAEHQAQVGQAIAETRTAIEAGLGSLSKEITAPRKVVTDSDGNVIGSVSVNSLTE